MAHPTKSDLETVIAAYEAIASRDFEAMMKFAAADGVLMTRLETYRGRDELRRYYEDIVPSDMTSRPEAFLLTDQGLVVLSEISMVGQSSQIATSERIAECWQIEGGLVREMRVMGRAECLGEMELQRQAADIETLHASFEEFNRGDFDAALERVHPDIVWNRGALMVGEETLRGVDAVRELLEPEVFEDQAVEVESIVVVADRYLATVVFSARGAMSGIEMSNRGYQVWTLRDGKATQLDFFQEREEALDFLFEGRRPQEAGDSGST